MRPDQVAAQLYTVRGHYDTLAEFARTAAKLSSIGYRAIELCGVAHLADAHVASVLRDAGLVACASHEDPEDVLTRPAAVAERLGRLGCRIAVYPFPKNVDLAEPRQIENLAQALDRAGAVLRSAGMKLCYHNHSTEFVRFRGKTILDFIFAETLPQNLAAELDTYWVQFGGGDPVDWCRQLKGRLPCLHLKDYRFTPENIPQLCEVGAGNLRFDRIVEEAEKSGCEWFIVEQDVTPADPFLSLQESYSYLREHLIDSKEVTISANPTGRQAML